MTTFSPIVVRVAARYLRLTTLKPLHTFLNEEDQMESYVWVNVRGKYNVTVKDLGSGEMLPYARTDIATVGAAVELAKKWVGVPHRQLHATEFPTEEHPGADPSKHTVKEDEKAEGKEPSEKAKSWLGRAAKEVQSFFSDPKARREGLARAANKLQHAPRNVGLAAIESVRGELKDAGDAFAGLKSVMHGGELTDQQKVALKKVAIKTATALATTALVSAFPAVLASGVIGKQIAKHVAKMVMQRALGGMTGVKLAGAVEPQPEAWLGEALARQVGDALENLSEEDLHEILEGAAEADPV